MLKVLDLFSGIGGFSLGLERTSGFETVAFCEIDPYCRKVLAKHWPGVPIHEDVRELTSDDVGPIDVICGGFPCQDISLAGKGAGLEGARSGLWSEIARLAGELRPRYVLVENVTALLNRGMDKVLGDLAALGYDAEWNCIRAADVGLPHARERLFIVAYADSVRELQPDRSVINERRRLLDCFQEDVWPLCNSGRSRGCNGFSSRMDMLGNAVVPQIPEILGNAILDSFR